MARDNENKNVNWSSKEISSIGEVMIADDVIATIAGLAATEVEGVSAMQGNVTNELVGKLGMKNLTKGVRIKVTEAGVVADLSIQMRYGYSIPKTCKAIQEKVKTAIENMVGLSVEVVNVHIVGVDTDTTR
ncbi:MAG: Asp23/Gls24 family envelope stress response protein [Lachnospiraceae bacterium]|nr:Asp23/Gls24 family envelope stress response protein [Lachnospiraceae bacterium]